MRASGGRTIGPMPTEPGAARARGDGSDVRGLYVHIPFCARRCTFCDFVTGPDGPGRVDAYLDALLREAQRERAELPRVPPLATLYLGGGTPSLVPAGRLERFLGGLRAIFPLAPEAEVTLEANPEDLDAQRLAAYGDAGVNRLSVGVQALDDPSLAFLNRGHSPSEAVEAILRAQRTGFANVSADLLFGIPAQSEAAYFAGVERVLDLGVPHLSVYALTVEERSVLGMRARRGAEVVAAEEEFARLYHGTLDRAAARGVDRYEISNHARRGFESRHNVSYWRRESVLGIGVGAVGMAGGARWRNAGSIERYVKHAGVPDREWDDLTLEARATEALFLGLRLREGVRLAELAAEFGPRLLARVEPALRQLEAERLVEREAGAVRLSRRGLLLSDAVFRELVLLPGDLDDAPRACVAAASSG
jgi:oxygen-independent coproporphyrinogen-3 oxidase